MFAALVCAAAAFSPPMQLAPRSVAVQSRAEPLMVAHEVLGRRTALLALAALPLSARADSIEEIAARNAAAAAAAKSPEALAAKEAKEKDGENNTLFADVAIGAILLGATGLSLAPVSENVKRVGDKVRTGKGRKY